MMIMTLLAYPIDKALYTCILNMVMLVYGLDFSNNRLFQIK